MIGPNILYVHALLFSIANYFLKARKVREKERNGGREIANFRGGNIIRRSER